MNEVLPDVERDGNEGIEYDDVREEHQYTDYHCTASLLIRSIGVLQRASRYERLPG